MSDPRVSDDLIREAFDRRARRATPMGLRGSILEATASTRQHRSPWNIRDGGTSLRLLAVAALLVTGLTAGTFFVGSALVAEKPTTATVGRRAVDGPRSRRADHSRGCRRTFEHQHCGRNHDSRVLPTVRVQGGLEHSAQVHRYASEWTRRLDRLHVRGRRALSDRGIWDHRARGQGRHGLVGAGWAGSRLRRRRSMHASARIQPCSSSTYAGRVASALARLN